METIICSSCTNIYDEKRKPILLSCGHTICKKCLSKLMYAEKSFFCPFDRSFIRLAECKINLRVQRIAENSSKKFPEIISDLKSSSKKRRSKSKSRLKGLTNLCNDFSKTQREIFDDSTEVLNTSTYSNYLSPLPKNAPSVSLKSPRNINNYKHAHIPPRFSPTQLDYHEDPRRKRHHRRKKSHKHRSNVSEYSYTQAALLTVSVIGGIYLFNKLSLGHTGGPNARSIFVAIKEGAQAVSSGLLKMIN